MESSFSHGPLLVQSFAACQSIYWATMNGTEKGFNNTVISFPR
jgi:hypothetical protein